MSSGKEALIGTWRLASVEFRKEDGTIDYPQGHEPRGLLIYTANGRIAVQISASNRRHFPTADIWESSYDDLRRAFETYNAHFGRYDVHWDEGFVVHHVEGALLPNWVDGDQIRYFKLDGDTLELRSPRLQAGNQAGYAALVWKRDTT